VSFRPVNSMNMWKFRLIDHSSTNE